jgi:hypothetical protein
MPPESLAIAPSKRSSPQVAILRVFKEEYLRASNAQDTARLLEFNKNSGFLGMHDSIDCMH